MLRCAALVTLLLIPLTAPAQSPSIVLTTGREVRASLTAGDTGRYQMTVDSNTLVRVVVTQVSVDAVVRVLGPRKQVIQQVDGTSRGEERLQFFGTTAGVYQVEVLPFEQAAGDYGITLLGVEPLAKDPRRLADQLLAPYARRDGPGAAVSVWRDGKTVFTKAYGMANLAYNVPFTAATPTNIGSTSKQFTAFAVMLLVEQGKLALDDNIRKYIPEVPDFGKTVTLRHLLSHTSGYREFLNALSLTGRRLDHGDFIDRGELLGLLQRQPALQNDPGAEFNYNNTAFGLAATIVERVSGQDFPEFMTRNVFEPLGMAHTQVRRSPEHVVPGMSQGYASIKRGGWRAVSDLWGAMGAGSIYSTVGDLQKWVANYANPKVGTAATVTEMLTPNTLTDGKSSGYGLGLFIDTHQGLKRVHHGGADMAHRSQLVYYPEINAGITVQSNDAAFNSGLAFRLAEAFFADAMKPPTAKKGAADVAFDPAAFKPEAFDPFVGRYALDAAPTFVLTFTRVGDSLFTQATGQPRFPIFPVSDSTFALRVVEASVTFHRDASGKVTGATLHQNGDQHATRVDGDVAASWKPTPKQLDAYAGRYFSEELETFYTITHQDGTLRLQHRRLDPRTMAPGVEDSFSGDGITLAFERDRSGQIIGLYASNTRTRDVRFERVSPPAGR